MSHQDTLSLKTHPCSADSDCTAILLPPCITPYDVWILRSKATFADFTNAQRAWHGYQRLLSTHRIVSPCSTMLLFLALPRTPTQSRANWMQANMMFQCSASNNPRTLPDLHWHIGYAASSTHMGMVEVVLAKPPRSCLLPHNAAWLICSM